MSLASRNGQLSETIYIPTPKTDSCRYLHAWLLICRIRYSFPSTYNGKFWTLYVIQSPYLWCTNDRAPALRKRNESVYSYNAIRVHTRFHQFHCDIYHFLCLFLNYRRTFFTTLRDAHEMIGKRFISYTYMCVRAPVTVGIRIFSNRSWRLNKYYNLVPRL